MSPISLVKKHLRSHAYYLCCLLIIYSWTILMEAEL